MYNQMDELMGDTSEQGQYWVWVECWRETICHAREIHALSAADAAELRIRGALRAGALPHATDGARCRVCVLLENGGVRQYDVTLRLRPTLAVSSVTDDPMRGQE